MENEIQVFNNPAFGELTTTISENGRMLFKANDVARTLGYSNVQQAIRVHCKGVLEISTPTKNQYGAVFMQPTKFIGESDVYRLVMRSKLPEAEKFQDWVVEDILPTIRRHGAYMTDEAIEKALLNPDTVIQLATSLKEEREARRALEIKNAQQVALIAEQEIKIQDMSEKSIYCEHVLASKALVGVSLIAQDYGTTGQTFNRFLHTAGVQFPQGGTWNLYEDYKYKGYTQSKSINFKHKDGTPDTKLNTMWTQKGRMFLYKFLKEKYGVLPIVERSENYVQPFGLMSSTAKKEAKKK